MEKKKETVVSVHRCRFVDYAPSAITALAYPPPPLPSIKGKRKAPNGSRPHEFGVLAVGHANGNVDLCEWMGSERDVQCPQAWVVRKTLSGPYPSKVDSLVFIIRHPDELESGEVPQLSQLRLFSSGGGSELIEWNLQRSCIRQTISSQGGSIWSIAANPSCTSLALGCEDGTVRILSVADDTLTHSRRFDRVKCRMLSIAWGPPIPKKPIPKPTSANREDSSDDDDEDEWTDSWLVTGGSDSSLRKWDVATGSVMDRMGVDKVRGERTLVWTVGVLGDGTIVSGDSLGSVKFWDSRTCTQLYSFQAHGADVLCMAISLDGKQLYTAGVDQKTIQFSCVKTSSNSRSSSTWTQTTSKRMHSHDVRALAMWPPYAPLPSTTYRSAYPLDIAPILTSGGLDMSVVLTPAAPPSSTLVKVVNPLDTSVEATFEDSYHRKLSYVGRGRVKVARGARLVSCAREAGISVWRIHKRRKVDVLPDDEGGDGEDLEAVYGKIDEEPAWEKVLEMDLKVHSNIVAHEISDDGKWLVVSDLYENKLFSLRTDDNGQISIKRIKDFPSILQAQIPSSKAHPNSTGGSVFHFTPDSSKLVLATSLSSYILVVDLTGEKPRILRRFDHHRSQDSIVRNRVVTGKLTASTKPISAPKVNGVVNGDVDMAEPHTNGVTGSESEEAETGMDEDKDLSSDDEDAGVSSEPTAIVSIDRMVISTDGQWLATSDNQARTHIFNLDSISHHTILPSFPTPIQTLSFDPQHPSVLLLVFANNTIQIYDVESRHFPVWGKDLANSLPKKFTSNHEVVLGVMWDPYVPTGPSDTVEGGKRGEGKGQTRYLLFWGSTWLFKIALETTRRTGGFGNSKKRRRDAGARSATGANAVEGSAVHNEDNPTDMYASMRDTKMITQYRPILCCDFLSKDELVVVERPLVDVLLTLPPAYFKPKYGAS